jgi:cystathionine beta-lyase family protein involved in aluminum resistance
MIGGMKLWSNILIVVGSLGILLGSFDPMEGSLIILPGSGLVALGVYLGRADPKVIKFWLVAFVLNAIGVGALWGLSAVGGIGGTSGRSLWWGVLILPYLFGWLMGLVRILATLIEKLRGRGRTPAGVGPTPPPN